MLGDGTRWRRSINMPVAHPEHLFDTTIAHVIEKWRPSDATKKTTKKTKWQIYKSPSVRIRVMVLISFCLALSLSLSLSVCVCVCVLLISNQFFATLKIKISQFFWEMEEHLELHSVNSTNNGSVKNLEKTKEEGKVRNQPLFINTIHSSLHVYLCNACSVKWQYLRDVMCAIWKTEG